jgi:hypothetical protein
MEAPKKRKHCYAFLPHAGLGNKLLVWAQCVVFAKNNNCGYSVTGWYHLHLRTLLKIAFMREKRHEYYFDPFKTGPFQALEFVRFKASHARLVLQADSGKEMDDASSYYFKDFNRNDHFETLRDYRNVISNVFWSTIKKTYIPTGHPNRISIHIRRRDFITMGWVTPIDYYKQTLLVIRRHLGFQVQTTIYTDGTKEELDDILKEPNTIFYQSVNPIYDMLSMSRSELIVLSANSTYGMWAAFLSEAIIIRKREDFAKGYIRSETDRSKWYEGELNSDSESWPDLLREGLKAMR